MCVICTAALEKYFPGISGSEQHSLLWNATAFPFGDNWYVATQLAEKRQMIDELKERPGWTPFDSKGMPLSDVEIAVCIANAEIAACMKNEVKI